MEHLWGLLQRFCNGSSFNDINKGQQYSRGQAALGLSSPSGHLLTARPAHLFPLRLRTIAACSLSHREGSDWAGDVWKCIARCPSINSECVNNTLHLFPSLSLSLSKPYKMWSKHPRFECIHQALTLRLHCSNGAGVNIRVDSLVGGPEPGVRAPARATCLNTLAWACVLWPRSSVHHSATHSPANQRREVHVKANPRLQQGCPSRQTLPLILRYAALSPPS